MSKLTICIDFDGVIHTYDKGWLDGSIYGDVTPGFFEWALEAAKTFRLVIHSSREMNDIRDWMVAKSNEWCKKHSPELVGPIPLEYSRTKPPAFISIDDRALTFTGNWEEFHPEKLQGFKPWNAVPSSPHPDKALPHPVHLMGALTDRPVASSGDYIPGKSRRLPKREG